MPRSAFLVYSLTLLQYPSHPKPHMPYQLQNAPSRPTVGFANLTAAVLIPLKLHAQSLPLDHLPEQMQPFVHHRAVEVAVLESVRDGCGKAPAAVQSRAADFLHPHVHPSNRSGRGCRSGSSLPKARFKGI